MYPGESAVYCRRAAARWAKQGKNQKGRVGKMRKASKPTRDRGKWRPSEHQRGSRVKQKLSGILFVFLLLASPQLSWPQEWKREWGRVLEAARGEGKVAVIGPTGSDRRDSLVQPFEKKYGIAVEYLSDRGAGIGARLPVERRARRYNWDVVITGTTTGINVLIPGGMLDPLEPALILPEVTDTKQWRGGEREYIDPERRFFVMVRSLFATLFVNPTQVRPEEIKSYKDLLHPRWKGKIVTDDPTRPGPGLGTFTFFYLHPDLGPNYIRALAKQELVIMRDYMQELDSIVKGKHLVLIGTSDSTADEWARKGLPVTIVDARHLKEGSGMSPQAGGLGLFNRAPHPNAAKVYINWLLSKEGQSGFVRAAGYISTRLDAPTDHAPWRVPMPGAINTYSVEATTVVKDKVLAVVKEAFGR